MVIRDLTLRSAASFGSFHLIRLLYDEYMFYLVEHRVAEATGETPIAVMGEVSYFLKSFFTSFMIGTCFFFLLYYFHGLLLIISCLFLYFSPPEHWIGNKNGF